MRLSGQHEAVVVPVDLAVPVVEILDLAVPVVEILDLVVPVVETLVPVVLVVETLVPVVLVVEILDPVMRDAPDLELLKILVGQTDKVEDRMGPDLTAERAGRAAVESDLVMVSNHPIPDKPIGDREVIFQHHPARGPRLMHSKAEEVVQIGVVQIEAVQIEAVQIEAVQIEAVQIEAVQIEAVQIGVVQIEVVQIEVVQIGAVQIGVVQIGAVQIGAVHAQVWERPVVVAMRSIRSLDSKMSANPCVASCWPILSFVSGISNTYARLLSH
jgi:hypothetical protein